MLVRKLIPLMVAVLLMAMAIAPAAQASKPAQATMAATMAGTMDVSNNPYLASLTRRLNETYDTSKFKKNPPYKLALASQGPTNSWATLFDAHARWEVSKLGKDVVSDLLYADANGSADKQVPQVEDLLSQNPDALILV